MYVPEFKTPYISSLVSKEIEEKKKEKRKRKHPIDLRERDGHLPQETHREGDQWRFWKCK